MLVCLREGLMAGLKLITVKPTGTRLPFLVSILCLTLVTTTFGIAVHAQDDGMLPEATLVRLSPSPVQEGTRLMIVVGLAPPVPEDSNTVIRGGIMVFDSSYGTHATELIAWAFRAGSERRELTYLVRDDGQVTTKRTIRVALHPGWEDHRIGSPHEITVSVSDSDSEDDKTTPTPRSHSQIAPPPTPTPY